MTPARIADLLHPFLAAPVDAATAPKRDSLSTDQLESISTYIDILLRWNSRINLTAIRNPEQIVTRHFGESLFAARVLHANDQRLTTNDVFSVADVGSGAGFPGIPLKLWNPAIHLTLIESNHKKATFLHEVARALTLRDIDIQNTRAESLPPASFDLVSMRAVERFESALPTAASLVKPLGLLALLIGEAQSGAARSTLPKIKWSDPVQIPESRSRILLLGIRRPVSN